MSAHRLAEAQIRSPDGSAYGVRVVGDAPISGLSKIAGLPNDPLGTTVDLIKINLAHGGSKRGWTVEVFKPATKLRAERVLYTQPVGAAAIVVDVTIAITDAITRGDKLWRDKDGH